MQNSLVLCSLENSSGFIETFSVLAAEGQKHFSLNGKCFSFQADPSIPDKVPGVHSVHIF